MKLGMKSVRDKWAVFLSIFLILGDSIFGLFYFLKQSDNLEDNNLSAEYKTNTTVLRSLIFEGTIESSYKTKGKVILNMPEMYTEMIRLSL